MSIRRRFESGEGSLEENIPEFSQVYRWTLDKNIDIRKFV